MLTRIHSWSFTPCSRAPGTTSFSELKTCELLKCAPGRQDWAGACGEPVAAEHDVLGRRHHGWPVSRRQKFCEDIISSWLRRSAAEERNVNSIWSAIESALKAAHTRGESGSPSPLPARA